MTPADMEALRFALANVNAPRSKCRLDASLSFRYLNRKYSRAEVDRVRKEMEARDAKR